MTRQELYDLVWSDAVDRVSGDLGLSGRGLGKLCARYNIPVPPRGYWAQKAAGHAVSQPPLPWPERHVQQVPLQRVATTAPAPRKRGRNPLEQFELDVANRISVPDDLPLTDALVLKTQRLARKASPGADGLLPRTSGGLSIRVSPPQLDRAVRVLQALMTAFAVRTFNVVVGEKESTVTILEEALGFAVVEVMAQVPHRRSAEEVKRIERGWSPGTRKWDYVPSRRLALAITNTNVGGVRQSWNEGTKTIGELMNPSSWAWSAPRSRLRSSARKPSGERRPLRKIA